MEIAYSLLGILWGPHHVWAVYRVPKGVAANVEPDDEVTANIQCRRENCAISRIAKRSGAALTPEGMTISGRIIGTDEQTHDVVLIPDPFPIEVPQALYAQLEMQPGQTKIVSVTYNQLGSVLVFHDLRLVGKETREPFQWK